MPSVFSSSTSSLLLLPLPPSLLLFLLFSLVSLVFCFVSGDVRVGKCLTNSSKCTQETVYLRYRYDAVVQKDFIYSVSCRSLCLLFVDELMIFFFHCFSRLNKNTITTTTNYNRKEEKLLQSKH